MKKYIGILLIPFLFACGRAAKEKAVELQARNDSLMTQSKQKDVAINDFMKSVNDIQGLLDSIKTRENIISVNAQKMGEAGASSRQQIRNDITSIYGMLVQDKQRLYEMERKLKNSGIKLAEFQKMVDNLQQQIADKDKELADLHDQLTKMNIDLTAANHKIDTLNTVTQAQGQQIESQSKTIADQTTSLNTAWYFVGDSKKLKDSKIMKGGKLLQDFNRDLFTKVDIRNITEIPAEGKKVKILSNHPSSSYKLEMDGKKVKALNITDEKAFWSNTRYLVIEVD
ncbi:MAG TPA: hypothetical protein VMC08_08820 [Bacteroidales bacterium]|nr:hypothetical protein [Bacteroidales bacterium]